MSRLLATLGRLRRDEDGNVTIEFVILFPIFFTLMLMAFELSLVTARATMLERGVDLVVRDLRLGTGATPDYETIRDRICERSLMIPDCANSLRLELRSLPLEDWDDVAAAPACVNRAAPVDPAQAFQPGIQNELMMIGVCALFEPIFPTTGLGYRLRHNDEGDYAIRSVAAFVNEPAS